MHPDDRLTSIPEFRDELFLVYPLMPVRRSGRTDRVIMNATRRWGQAVRDNSWLFLIIVMLFVVALVSTILSPDLPPALLGAP
jgi:hypothetical protein